MNVVFLLFCVLSDVDIFVFFPPGPAAAAAGRASGDGARCKNDRDSTTEGAVRADCGTVGRVTGEAGPVQLYQSHSEVNDGDKHRHVVILFTRVEYKPIFGCRNQATEPKPGREKKISWRSANVLFDFDCNKWQEVEHHYPDFVRSVHDTNAGKSM